MTPVKPGKDQVCVTTKHGGTIELRIGDGYHGTRFTDLQPWEARQ